MVYILTPVGLYPRRYPSHPLWDIHILFPARLYVFSNAFDYPDNI